MKTYLRILTCLFVSVIMLGCESDDDQLVNLGGIQAPSDLGATFEITQDNSGFVTIIPTGEGAVQYQVDFGDGSPVSEGIGVGEKVEHIYEEGQYEVVITGENLAGETAQGTQELNVSFLAPENLEVEIIKAPDDNFSISVSATADNAAMFEVYFRDAEDEEPTPLMLGETIEHTYENVGTYNVRVVALSGGAATTEVVQEVIISNPLFLPIDFESETLDYTFFNFGGGDGPMDPVVDNPAPDAVNSSEKVAAYTKPVASEPWAGTNIELDEPIDFSETRYVGVDVWSPVNGAPVTFKLENKENAEIFVEATATTTVSEQWETLIFDLSTLDPAVEYGRIVLFFNMNVPGTGETYYFDNIKTTKLELMQLPLTFESESLSYEWAGFGGAGGGTVENPDASGINTSATVTELNKSSGAQTWAGISLGLDEPIDFSTGTFVKMKVWSPEAGVPILLKLEDSNSATNSEGNPSVFVEVTANTSTSGEWEELVFDLTSSEAFSTSESYDTVIVFYDFDSPGEGSSFYFDDIRLSANGDAGPSDPTAGAPAPTLPEEDVISWFSDAYTNIEIATWRASWSGGTLEDVPGGAVKKYVDLDFVGIEPAAPVDASEMTHFHTDIWTENMTQIRIKLVDFGADGAYAGGDDVEHEILIENPLQKEWVSLDVPLSEFAGLTTKGSIAQLIYSGAPTGEGILYIDNVYFHN